MLDVRWRLAFPVAPGRTAAAVAIGAALLLWDAAGSRQCLRGGRQPLLVGLDLAPHLPVEEPVFLVFLSYLRWSCGPRPFARRASVGTRTERPA